MKLTALSLAAIFAFFAQTMAEPLPQGIPAPANCTTQVFHCRSSLNISVIALILTDLRRRRYMCKLIIPCEVAQRLGCILTVVGFFCRDWFVSIPFPINWSSDWRVLSLFKAPMDGGVVDLFPWNLVERRFFFILNSIWILILISFKVPQRKDRNLPSLNLNSYFTWICRMDMDLVIKF